MNKNVKLTFKLLWWQWDVTVFSWLYENRVDLCEIYFYALNALGKLIKNL